VPSLRSGPLLLRAEDPFKHGGVPEVLRFDDFAVAEREYIGFGCGFPAGGDLGEDDHDIVVGEETAGHYCKGLSRPPSRTILRPLLCRDTFR
jgi:hypothetical protein